MATRHLQPDCTPGTIIDWYQSATVGDTAVITLSSPTYPVRLIRQPGNHVHWWPQGAQGMTMPLEDAMVRLQLLRNTSLPEA
jgi:hypothetical protein